MKTDVTAIAKNAVGGGNKRTHAKSGINAIDDDAWCLLTVAVNDRNSERIASAISETTPQTLGVGICQSACQFWNGKSAQKPIITAKQKNLALEFIKR